MIVVAQDAPDERQPLTQPFDTLARQHTQLVCGMNLAIMTAIVDRVDAAGLTARLEPASERCCVILDAG